MNGFHGERQPGGIVEESGQPLGVLLEAAGKPGGARLEVDRPDPHRLDARVLGVEDLAYPAHR